MQTLPRVLLLFAFYLLLPVVPTTAQAQQCFEVFEDLTDPSWSCADTFYFVDGLDGDPSFQSFGDGDNGVLGAEFD